VTVETIESLILFALNKTLRIVSWSAFRYAMTYIKKLIDLNTMVHAFLFNMTTNIIVAMRVHVVCRKILGPLGKYNCQ